MAKKKRNPNRQRLPYQLPANLIEPELDIVIPVYGRPDLLKQCLASVEATCLDINYRVIIVDDKSPNQAEMDAVYSVLNGSTTVIKSRQNQGFPATASAGAAKGHARSILFLNSDIELKSGAIRAMLDMLWTANPPEGMMDPTAPPTVGVVGAKLLFAEGTKHGPAGKIQHAGMAFNISGQPIHPCIGWSADHPKVNIQRSIQIVTGALMMTKRLCWDAVTASYRAGGDPAEGGFNPVYGKGTFEDVEYCIAARGNGYRVVYEPSAVAYHHVGASSADAGEGFQIKRNHAIFVARCAHLTMYDEFYFW